jgi:hypothetical protein
MTAESRGLPIILQIFGAGTQQINVRQLRTQLAGALQGRLGARYNIFVEGSFPEYPERSLGGTPLAGHFADPSFARKISLVVQIDRTGKGLGHQ